MNNKTTPSLQERVSDVLQYLDIPPAARELIYDLKLALSNRISNSVLNSTACKHIRTIHKLRDELEDEQAKNKRLTEAASEASSELMGLIEDGRVRPAHTVGGANTLRVSDNLEEALNAN